MKKIKISSDELLFCLYNEGLFEQGLALKQIYHPNISDDELNLIFQVTCRSLISKDMLEFKNNKYQLKSEFKGFIRALNYSPYSIKVSKFIENDNQVTWNAYFTEKEPIVHSILDNQQVHVIYAYDTVDEVVSFFEAILEISHTIEEPKKVFVCTGEQMEVLLTGITENVNKIEEFTSITGKSLEIMEFIEDLKARNGKMDSVMTFETKKGEDQSFRNLSFIIPGKKTTWIITGSSQNAFTLLKANKKLFEKVILEDAVYHQV